VVDGAAYFRAFRDIVLRARHDVYIVAWDVYSELELVRGAEPGFQPVRLRELLNGVAAQAHAPRVYVLDWDFAMLYAADREWLPVYKLNWTTHPRVCFRLDDHHPVGGSHHQKIVVVDDAVAFAGGLDLTHSRWDTPEHRPDDERRTNPQTGPYRPHHDVQLMVTGDAARALGELVRERWRRACGQELAAPDLRAAPPWPPDVVPDLETVEVAIARTEPSYAGRDEVREVEQLYLDAIAEARRWIYIENQYLTSARVGEALARRLAEDHGPEVVIVLPRHTRGWLSRQTMDVFRARWLRRLRETDQHRRLRVLYPHLPGLEPDCVNVHSKVMIVDDRLVRVGSANLNNRSMGLDTECDLAIESRGDRVRERAIGGFRSRLLAEHLACDPASVHAAVKACGSLIHGIAQLSGRPRTLKDLEPTLPREVGSLLPDASIVDPERPVDPEVLVDELVHEKQRKPAERRVIVWLFLLGVLFALSSAWPWTPFSQYLDPPMLLHHADRFRELPGAPLLTVAAFVVAGLMAFPVTLLIIATVLTFGPLIGFACSLTGALASALVTYAVGARLGRDAVRRLAGERIRRLSRRIGKRGMLTIVLMRVVPIAPFAVINLVAGASHIGWRDFTVGTLLGMSPGILAVTVFAARVRATLTEPTPRNVAILTATFLAIALAGYTLVRWLMRHTSGRGGGIREQ
jgi:phospholipase D1/2